MTTYTMPKVKIKTIKCDDPMFYIRGDFTIAARAGLEISQDCPREYRLILAKCIDQGWVRPIAFMRDDEYLLEALKQ